MTYKDYKNKGWIDERYNFFMSGIAISLVSHVKRNIIYMLTLILVIIILFTVFKKKKILGEGDIQAISWILMGLGILGVPYFIIFSTIFITCTLIYILMKKYIFRYKLPTPFFGVLLISFVTNAILMKLY